MSTSTTVNPYSAGKRAPGRWRDAVRILREQSLRKRAGLRVNIDVSMMAWGSIVAAAQLVDPSVNHRYAAIVALGINRDDLFGGRAVAGFGGSVSAVCTGT